MYNIALDHPNLKTDNSILYKSSFLRPVKYNNLVPSDISLYNCVPETGQFDPEKGQRKKKKEKKEKGIAQKRKSVAMKRTCCGEEEDVVVVVVVALYDVSK